MEENLIMSDVALMALADKHDSKEAMIDHLKKYTSTKQQTYKLKIKTEKIWNSKLK
jgi:hypothetical protein